MTYVCKKFEIRIQVCINKVVGAHAGPLCIMYGLWLLSTRQGQRPHRPQSEPKIATIRPFKKKLPLPFLYCLGTLLFSSQTDLGDHSTSYIESTSFFFFFFQNFPIPSTIPSNLGHLTSRTSHTAPLSVLLPLQDRELLEDGRPCLFISMVPEYN